MIKINSGKYLAGLLFGLGIALLQSACAQSPHKPNADIVAEQHLIERSTALLNNEQQIIPIQNLEVTKVASVHFTYAYSTVFDSLLNKYAKVQSFNGSQYTGVNALNELADDLKMYNTVIVELSAVEAPNQQYLNFINATSKLKKVVVVLFGKGNMLAAFNNVTVPVIWSERETPLSASYTAQVCFWRYCGFAKAK